MSAIAYITDSKMLELHRLNAHKEMNFWRLSSNINFSDFKVGDLIFFLSKDKEYINNKEKGIVGYGRLSDIHLNSVKYLWDRYGILNGYNTLKEFKEAIRKVSKERKLPNKISSFYLTNVVFFQAPVYLSECGMNISSNVESYIYLKPEDVAMQLLEYAKESLDIWSNETDQELQIEKEQLTYALYTAHKAVGDIELSEVKRKKIYKELKKYVEEHNEYSFLQTSRFELYKIVDNNIEILFYNDKDIDKRMLLGQSKLYIHYLNEYYPYDVNVIFRTLNDDKDTELLLNE